MRIHYIYHHHNTIQHHTNNGIDGRNMQKNRIGTSRVHIHMRIGIRSINKLMFIASLILIYMDNCEFQYLYVKINMGIYLQYIYVLNTFGNGFVNSELN